MVGIWNAMTESIYEKVSSASEFIDKINQFASEVSSDVDNFRQDIAIDIANIKDDVAFEAAITFDKITSTVKEKTTRFTDKTEQVAKKVYKNSKQFVKDAPDNIQTASIQVSKRTSRFAKDTYNDPSGQVNKVWNGFTGKTTFDEAEKLLKSIEDKYDKVTFEYKRDIKKLSLQLKSKIRTINYHKKDIFENHFNRFKHMANKLHNLDIEGKSFLEYFDDNIAKIKIQNGVQSKNDLYEIDFNNLKIQERALGILTFGFYTRKKAKQTLEKVKAEEKRINLEIQNMKSQITNINVVLKSINSVAKYFTVLIQNYTKLLDRFEYGISSQIFKTVLKKQVLKDGKLDFKLMPILHIEEFQALFNLSIVLKQMATMGYLTDECEINKNDQKVFNDIQYKIEQIELIVS